MLSLPISFGPNHLRLLRRFFGILQLFFRNHIGNATSLFLIKKLFFVSRPYAVIVPTKLQVLCGKGAVLWTRLIVRTPSYPNKSPRITRLFLAIRHYKVCSSIIVSVILICVNASGGDIVTFYRFRDGLPPGLIHFFQHSLTKLRDLPRVMNSRVIHTLISSNRIHVLPLK